VGDREFNVIDGVVFGAFGIVAVIVIFSVFHSHFSNQESIEKKLDQVIERLEAHG